MGWSFYNSSGQLLTAPASTATADTATVATTVTVTDNENTDENNVLTFVAGADADGGNAIITLTDAVGTANTIDFLTLGDTATLMWTGTTGWAIMSHFDNASTAGDVASNAEIVTAV